MSNLGLSILAKENKQKTLEHNAVPNNEMVQRKSHLANDNFVQMAARGSSRQRHRQQHRQLLQQDDLGDTDIMAYSAMTAGADDETTVFSSGGAIMDALEQKAPVIKGKLLA